MKKITLITFLIIFISFQINAQIDLENISYDRNYFQNIETKLYQHQKVIISEKTQQIILKKHKENTLPFEYFIGLMTDLQPPNNTKKNDWLDKTKDLSIKQFCDCEPNRISKGQCSDFIKALKKFTLKFQMIEAFKKKKKSTYLQLYQAYKYDLETEHHQYQYGLFPERFGFCGQHKIGDIFWYKDSSRIIMNFIMVDYLMHQNKINQAFSQISRVMNNNIIYLEESDFVQELIAERVAHYIIKKDIRKAFKRQLKAQINDFIKNEKTDKRGIFYKRGFKIFDINLTLETLSEARAEPTPIQTQRFKQSLPIKTKKEIVKEFKSTLIYKIMTNKRYLKKYSSL